MIDVRVRAGIPEEAAKAMEGKLLTDAERSIQLTGPCRVFKPNGQLLCVYVPGALAGVFDQAMSARLFGIRLATNNRGMAGGTPRVNGPRKKAEKAVYSGILGAFDAYGGDKFCRLTAFTAKDVRGWEAVRPAFVAASELFREHVPDRYANQAAQCAATEPDWVIPGTVFTTITINNTYPTGVHTDKGDLDEGFSCIACLRRGAFTGGVLTFPRYGVGVDMQHGDLLLMDAHELHGNTPIRCAFCGEHLDKPGHTCEGVVDFDEPAPERCSIVCYYRTGMRECGDLRTEGEKARAVKELNARAKLGIA